MILNSQMENEKLYAETLENVESLRKKQLISEDQYILIGSCLRNVCIVICNSDLGVLPSVQDITTASLIRRAIKKYLEEEKQ